MAFIQRPVVLRNNRGANEEYTLSCQEPRKGLGYTSVDFDEDFELYLVTAVPTLLSFSPGFFDIHCYDVRIIASVLNTDARNGHDAAVEQHHQVVDGVRPFYRCEPDAKSAQSLQPA